MSSGYCIWYLHDNCYHFKYNIQTKTHITFYNNLKMAYTFETCCTKSSFIVKIIIFTNNNNDNDDDDDDDDDDNNNTIKHCCADK